MECFIPFRVLSSLTDLYFLLARYCRPFSSNPSNGRLYPARCLQKNKNKLNDTCTVRCNPGFIPRFSSLQTLTCYSNGFWSRTRITECVRKYHVHSRLGPLCSHCAIVKQWIVSTESWCGYAKRREVLAGVSRVSPSSEQKRRATKIQTSATSFFMAFSISTSTFSWYNLLFYSLRRHRLDQRLQGWGFHCPLPRTLLPLYKRLDFFLGRCEITHSDNLLPLPSHPTLKLKPWSVIYVNGEMKVISEKWFFFILLYHSYL